MTNAYPHPLGFVKNLNLAMWWESRVTQNSGITTRSTATFGMEGALWWYWLEHHLRTRPSLAFLKF